MSEDLNGRLDQIYRKLSEEFLGIMALEEHWDTVIRYCTWLTRADASSAASIDAEMASARESLRGSADDDLGTSFENISRRIGDVQWTGDGADAFLYEYLPGLETALQYQMEFAESLRGLAELHGAHVAATEETVLNIAKSVLELLDVVAEARSAERRRQLGHVVDILVQTTAGALTGGPAGAVAGALRGVGAAIVDDLNQVQGDNEVDVIASMVDSLRALRDGVKDDQEKMRDALKQLAEGFLRPGEGLGRMLPPKTDFDGAGDTDTVYDWEDFHLAE